MRDRIGRIVLGLLGGAAVIGGALALVGVLHVETRTATIIVAAGAIGNGAVVLRLALSGSKRAV